MITMTLSRTHTITGMKKQRGIVLVVALLILVVMTVLGVSMLSSSSLGERMASNLQSQNVTFQAAESCIRTALLFANKNLRDAAINNPDPANIPNASLNCAFDNNTVTAQVLYSTPLNASQRQGIIQSYSLGTFSGYVLTLDGSSTLASGASSTLQAVGKQPAPAP